MRDSGNGLCAPREIAVEVDGAGEPRRLLLGRRWRAVGGIQDRWRVDEEWWREEISRLYYRMELADGSVETLFQDLRSGKWFLQRY